MRDCLPCPAARRCLGGIGEGCVHELHPPRRRRPPRRRHRPGEDSRLRSIHAHGTHTHSPIAPSHLSQLLLRGWLTEFLDTRSGARITYFSITLRPSHPWSRRAWAVGSGPCGTRVYLCLLNSVLHNYFLFLWKYAALWDLQAVGMHSLVWSCMVENQCFLCALNYFVGCHNRPILHRGGFSEDQWCLSVTYRESCHRTHRARRRMCCSHVW